MSKEELLPPFDVFFEALHYIPGMGAVNAFDFNHLGLQLMLLAAGEMIYLVLTLISYSNACVSYDKIERKHYVVLVVYFDM